jgi:dipeptidase E
MSDINIYLSGGGGAEDSFLLDEKFMNGVNENKKILYIPLAMETDALGFEACYDWIINTLSKFSKEFVDIVMWTNLDGKSWDDIKDFGAIYIGGGNTFKLLNNIYDSGFINLLRAFIDAGKIVYGGSAGAIIMGKSINTVDEENDKKYRHHEGLDIISGMSIICHYTEQLDCKILNYISKIKTGVIALPEKTGLFISNSNAQVVGYEPAYLFDLNGGRNIVKIGRNIPL